MSFNVGNTPVSNVYVGNTAVSKIYIGNTEVWPLASSTPVAYGTTGTPAISGTGANTLTTANAPITIGSESNRMLFALVGVSNANTANWNTFDILTAQSSVDGSMTRLASISSNTSGANNGSLHLFYLANPTTGTANITSTVSMAGATWLDRVRVIPFYMYNVNQSTPFGTPVLRAVTGGANTTIVSTDSNNKVLFGWVGGTAPTAFNKTLIASFGSNDAGGGDYILAGYADGGVSQTFTTTNSTRNATFAVEILPA